MYTFQCFCAPICSLNRLARMSCKWRAFHTMKKNTHTFKEWGIDMDDDALERSRERTSGE